MPTLQIILNGDGAAKELHEAGREQIHVTEGIIVSALEAGMASGAPSVAFIIPLPEGGWARPAYVLAETSLKLFLSAADAFKARYGDPR